LSEAIFGLVGVLVGAVIQWIKEGLNTHDQRTRQARYLAAQVIRELDDFVGKCIDVVRDDGTDDRGEPAGKTKEGERFLEPQVNLPNEPIYPNDLDWRSIDGDLLYSIVMLPNQKKNIDRRISDAEIHDSPPFYDSLFLARIEGYSNLGLKALEIRNRLRKKYKLESLDVECFNPKEFLLGKEAEIKKLRGNDCEV
jgi:hypothetical protein